MRKWILRGAILFACLFVIALVVAWRLASHYEPYIREQAERYMERRFGSEVELSSLKVPFPLGSPWNIATNPLRISGEGLVLHYKNRTDLPPLIKVKKFSVESSLGALWKSPRTVHTVKLEGLEINVPPKRERKGEDSGSVRVRQAEPESGSERKVVVQTILCKDAVLRIYPDDPNKDPREFAIHDLRLKGAGSGQAMSYQAKLTNPTPPGEIDTAGHFGPWNRDDPGQTPIQGDYTFKNADLGVFEGIAGILDSTGEYKGVLEQIVVDGQTSTPDFRLFGDGNRVPLKTRFHSIVDGTSGDTYLQPVNAVLGSTRMIAKGGVIGHQGVKGRLISLEVTMRDGHLEDILRLAVRTPKPFMRGLIDLQTKLMIPPGKIPVIRKIALDGSFNLKKSSFQSATVQDKIDSLSRKAQGQPNNEEIDNVLSAIKGRFQMRNAGITFPKLNFLVPGAAIQLAGNYGVLSENIDFHGTAKLEAKVSQTQSGWKRWALKPVDPFFSKNGAGTFLRIKVVGTKDNPEFGLDRGKRNNSGTKQEKTD